MKQQKSRVIVNPNLSNPPSAHEIDAARIVAKHYDTVIEFLRPVEGYKIKTADFVMNGLMWEIKSPIGNSKLTVSRQFKIASKQSKFIVFDSRRTKLSDDFIEKQIRFEITKRTTIKKVIFIKKSAEILELTR
jgi:hypothetical protein